MKLNFYLFLITLFFCLQNQVFGQSPPALQVEGKWIKDASGNNITLRGVNVIDPEWVELDMGTIENAIDRVADMHAKVVRLPVHPSNWDGDNYYNNYLKPAIDYCKEKGLYVIIDWHYIGPWGSEELANQTNDFWNYVAPKHKDDTHVLFEFMNEPTEPRERTLATWNSWKDWAQQFVNTIRSHAPDNLILVGSPHWSQLCQFAPESPFEGSNLVYVMHLYPAWNSSEWPTLFGDAANSVPIFVSEWGYGSYTTADGHASNSSGHEYHGTTSGFGIPFKTYINSLPNVSWTAWVYHWAWNPPMIDQDYNFRGGEKYMGLLTAEWLYEKRNGDVPDNEIVAVTGVRISPTSRTIRVNTTLQLTAMLEPYYATNKNVSWSSSNESVANVDDNGLVTAVAIGNTTITVTTEEGDKTAISEITVESAPVGGSNLLNNGDFSQGLEDWELILNDASATASVVNGQAVIDISAAGAAEYQPQLVQDGFEIIAGETYNISFKASAASPRNINLYLSTGPPNYTAFITEVVALTTSMQSFSYTFVADSYDENARVDFNVGMDNANVTIDDVSLIMETDETDPTPIDPWGNLVLNPGFEEDLTNWEVMAPAIEIASGAENVFAGEKSVKVGTNDWSWIQQSPEGFVPGDRYMLKAAGKAISGRLKVGVQVVMETDFAVLNFEVDEYEEKSIEFDLPEDATFIRLYITNRAGGLGYFDNIEIVRVKNEVTGVAVDPSTASLDVGATQQLNATVAPTNASIPSVSWSSSDEDVATVDENGLVTAVGGGIATITVTTDDMGMTATSEIAVNIILSVDGAGEHPGFLIYPNPVKGTFTITLGSPSNRPDSIQIFSLAGTKMLETTLAGDKSKVTVDCGGLPAGLYILKIVGKSVNSQKIMVGQ